MVRIFINNVEIDLPKGFDFTVPLTFQVNDYRNLSTRNGDFSKQITVPASSTNKTVLGDPSPLAENDNIDTSINTCYILGESSVRIFDGRANILSRTTKEYKIQLLSGNSSWFSALEKGKLKDLDLGIYNYTVPHIISGWDTDGTQTNYYFPLIDYGGLTPDVAGTDQQAEETFLPGTFVGPILRNIFRPTGFNFAPQGRAKQLLNRLALPFTDGTVTPAGDTINDNTLIGTAADFSFQYDRNVLTDGTITVTNPITLNAEVQDINNNFNLGGTNEYTVPFNGSYSLSTKCKITLTVTNNSISDNVITTTATVGYLVNGSFLQPAGASAQLFSVGAGQTETITIDNSIVITRTYIATDTLEPTHSLTLVDTADGSNVDIVYDVDYEDIQSEIIPVKLDFQLNMDYDLASTLPNIQQRTFLRDITQLYNLIFETNVLTGQVKVYTADQYYKDIDSAENWDDKIDFTKIPEFRKYDQVEREFNFKFAEDDDDSEANAFTTLNSENISDFTTTLDDPFLQGSKNVANVGFVPTMMGLTLTDTLYTPLIIKEDHTGGNDFDQKHRLVYANGLQDGDFTMETVPYTEYPASYSILQDSTPGDDTLYFKNVQDTVGGAVYGSDIGNFQRYWSKTVDRLNNGKLLIANFFLNEDDILQLDFRTPKQIKINGDIMYFYLNKVEDYKIGQRKPVRCELMLIP